MPYKQNIRPKKGDIIRVKRALGYYHYGIYIGFKKVIHFAGVNGDNIFDVDSIFVHKAKLKIFVNSDTLEVNTPYDSPFKRKEVINRAKSVAKDGLPNHTKYNLLSNNCEHFANSCYYGENLSNQSNSVLHGFKKPFVKLGVNLVFKYMNKRQERLKEEKEKENLEK